MRKKPEVTEQTRKNIISAFCNLYETHPIEQIRVKDVIAIAGYNRSTFYEYFSDIYALLTYIEDDVINYIKAGRGTKSHTPKDLLHLLADKEEYLKVLLGSFGCVRFQERLKKELIPKQTMTNGDETLQSYLSEFHVAVSFSMYQLWLKRNKDISLDELITLIHELYTNGANGILEGESIQIPRN